MAQETQTSQPFLVWIRQTAKAFGILFKAIGIWFAFISVSSALAPLAFIGIILGMIPNAVKAAWSIVITIPLLLLLPFHAIYALLLIASGRTPTYTKGIYGASDWVERNQIYHPMYRRPRESRTT